MLQYIGESPAKAKESAKQILALEIELSAPRLDRVERRDRRKQYNPTAVADLTAQNWLPAASSIMTTDTVPKIR